MAEAKSGDKVKVAYTGKLADGTVFDSSEERGPLEMTIGQGEVIPGVENAVEGMKVGESKQVDVASQDAYGERDEQKVLDIPKSDLPDDLEPKVGMVLEGKVGDGQTIHLRIIEIGDDTIKADANHPLAGESLVFDLTLEEVVEA